MTFHRLGRGQQHMSPRQGPTCGGVLGVTRRGCIAGCNWLNIGTSPSGPPCNLTSFAARPVGFHDHLSGLQRNLHSNWMPVHKVNMGCSIGLWMRAVDKALFGREGDTQDAAGGGQVSIDRE